MTPPQAAKAHCDNYQSDNSRLGIRLKDDLSMYRFRKEGLTCLLCDGQRCLHFEEIVVPMRMSRETAEATLRADKKDKAVNAYLRCHKLIQTKSTAKKVCRTCRRVEVEGSQKFCYKCGNNRRKHSNRLSQRKRRSHVRKHAISPIDTEALTNANQLGGSSNPAAAKNGHQPSDHNGNE